MVPRPETGTIDAPGLAGAEPGTLQPQTERPVRPTSLVPILTGARKWKYIVTIRLVPPAGFRRKALRHVHSDVVCDVSYARRGDAGRSSWY